MKKFRFHLTKPFMGKPFMVLLAIALVFGAIAMTLASCGGGNGDAATPSGGDTSATYTGYDADGNAYTLVVTKAANRAAYSPKSGDTYVLTIHGANNAVLGKSTGTVDSVSGLTFTLQKGGGTFTIRVSGSNIASITDDIPLDSGGTRTPPASLTPSKPSGTPPVDTTPPAVTNLSGAYYDQSYPINYYMFYSDSFYANDNGDVGYGTYSVSGSSVTCKYNDGGYTFVLTIVDSTTLRASYGADWVKGADPVVYYITYDINGGSGTTPRGQMPLAGRSVILARSSGLSKSGSTFGGWNTKADGTGTNYLADTSFTPTGNITLYAKWLSTSGGSHDGTSGLAFTLINNNSAYSVKKGTVTSGAVVIPASNNGLPVTEIGSMAFWDTKITSVTIPSSVTTIGSGAFRLCGSLTSVTISNGVTTIGGGAFQDCANLTGFTIPGSVTSIGAHAFGTCPKIPSITIPSSVTSMDTQVFWQWTASQVINVENYDSQDAADAAWGASWRSGCNAVVNYQG